VTLFIRLLRHITNRTTYDNKKYLRVGFYKLTTEKQCKMQIYFVRQHAGYEVAIVTAGCFCTEDEIVTAGSGGFWRNNGVQRM